MGFPFLFALCASASLVIWFGVDVEKGRRDAVRFAEAHRASDGSRIVASGQKSEKNTFEDSSQTDSVKEIVGGDVNDVLITDVKA